MSWEASLAGGVLTGVLGPLILWIGKNMWSRGPIPKALSRTVRRPTYLSAVLAESQREDTVTLDVLAPRLQVANSSRLIRDIQVSWTRINDRGRVRVLTLDSDACIEGGSELLRNDIEVRVARRDIGTESLSFHLFETGRPTVTASAIVNRHDHVGDRPAILHGQATTAVFRTYFETLWEKAQPLESVIAERIISAADGNLTLSGVLRSLGQAAIRLNLDPLCVEKLLPHLAFRHACPVIFILGQPGAGKSYVRRRLVRQFTDLRIDSDWDTDYRYAYHALLRSLLKLESPRPSGFKAFEGGAFIVRDESVLEPALRTLALVVRAKAQVSEVTLVEFARSDLVGALRLFDEVSLRAEVIYVHAPTGLREDRLRRRASPPVTGIIRGGVNIEVSDDHLLPPAAQTTLYSADGFQELKTSPRWKDHLFEIDNSVDDDGSAVDAQLSDFAESIVAKYRHVKRPLNTGHQLAS